MKGIINYLLSVSLLCFSCDKKDPEITDTPCTSGNICFKLSDVPISQPATWRTISSTRIRLQWETMEGNNYKNVQLDVWGISTGVYSIKPQDASSPSATFQYFVTDGSFTRNWQGQSGKLTITSVENDKLSGSFTVSVKDTASGENKEVANGTFSNLSKK